MQNFAETLPEGYELRYTVDAKDKKTSILLNVASILLTVAVWALLWVLKKPVLHMNRELIFWDIALGVALLVYLVLHELVHGAAYKLLTHRKLTFGFTMTVAFCGVPNIYVSRKTALISLASPLVLFTVVFGALMFLLPSGTPQAAAIVMLAIHIGGCVGDIFDLGLFLFRFRNPEILMRDTGPTQYIYEKAEKQEA